MNVIFFVILSATLLTIVETLRRKLGVSNNLSRRMAHMGAGIINVVAPTYILKAAIIVVNILFVGILLVGRKGDYLSSILNVSRRTYGDVLFPLGIVLAATILLPQSMPAFQYGVAVMGISDALAGFVGERWGKKRVYILKNHKTLTGSIVFYISTLIITFFFVPHLSLTLFILPLVLTVIELVSVYGLDNLILPIISGLLFATFF